MRHAPVIQLVVGSQCWSDKPGVSAGGFLLSFMVAVPPPRSPCGAPGNTSPHGQDSRPAWAL